jgi:hypothetical protein
MRLLKGKQPHVKKEEVENEQVTREKGFRLRIHIGRTFIDFALLNQIISKIKAKDNC